MCPIRNTDSCPDRSAEPTRKPCSPSCRMRPAAEVPSGSTTAEIAGFQEDGGWEAQQAVANAAFASGVQSFGLEETLATIDKPILLIWGENDRVIPLKQAVAALTIFSDAVLKVLPDTGHVPQVERAPDVATAIDRFVRSLG